MIKSRIKIIDGFRGIAILAVVLFHLFSRYTKPLYQTSLYPYEDKYNYFSLGNLGVQFFFIISGFVIFYTLKNTNLFFDFWKKRLIRLVPSLIIASIITFFIFNIFDDKGLFPSSHKIINFLPSITFIAPDLLNKIFNIKFEYISGSYWSLWVEIQFYILSSALFYFNKEKFIKNLILLTIVIFLINSAFLHIIASDKLQKILPPEMLISYPIYVNKIINIVSYIHFFSIGVLFYTLFENQQLNQKTSLFIKLSLGFLLARTLFAGTYIEVRIIYLGLFLLFYFFIYYPQKLSFLENKLLTTIGVSSYFLYLIHEHIGVLLINKLCHYFLPIGFVFTLGLICILIYLSNFYTKKVEWKINRVLKNRF